MSGCLTHQRCAWLPSGAWREAMVHHVLPQLPGQWLAGDYDLVRLPAGPIACMVFPDQRNGHAVIQPLYVWF
jgi:hypothetical protein